jgi:hypothetical protein
MRIFRYVDESHCHGIGAPLRQVGSGSQADSYPKIFAGGVVMGSRPIEFSAHYQKGFRDASRGSYFDPPYCGRIQKAEYLAGFDAARK